MNADTKVVDAGADPSKHRWKGRAFMASRPPLPKSLAVFGLKDPPAATDIRSAEFDALMRRAGEAHSDAVVIMKDGQIVAEEYFGRDRGPIELMSCTKSIVSLGIGKLIDEGRIEAVDQPVHAFYPEWKQGAKKDITVRHLLNHTSGLQNLPDTRIEIYPAPDSIKLSLAAELTDPPGTRFSYNNKAVNLLSGIIELASGKRMDQYLKDAIFEPLGIFVYRWHLDAAGHPYAMAGCQLQAADFARIGQLVLGKGAWIDERVISADWIEEMLKPGQDINWRCGLLWWRHYAYERAVIDGAKLEEFRLAGVAAEYVEKVASLKDRVFESEKQVVDALDTALGPERVTVREREFASKGVRQLFKWTVGEIDAFHADGYLGQYMVIVPSHALVAVRQVRSRESYDFETDQFPDFLDRVLALVETDPPVA
jgi:CubicO group peptidase (beta-lactamase class C family)